MPSNDFIKALKIDENVFELVEPTKLRCLHHFAAPFTGGGDYTLPPGLRFAPYSPMREDAFYLTMLDKNASSSLREQIINQAKCSYPEKTRNRLTGISFFITEDELKSLNLRFISGSRERLLQIFNLMREEDRKNIEAFRYVSHINALLIEFRMDGERDNARNVLLSEAKSGNEDIILKQIDSSIKYANDKEKADYRELKEWLTNQMMK